jgi:hypothetical protein
MRMKAKYTLNFSINGDEDISVLEIKMEPIKGLNRNTNVYTPHVYLNGFKYDTYDDILEGYIDAKYAMDKLSKIYKKDLKARCRKEKKQFRLINEKLD